MANACPTCGCLDANPGPLDPRVLATCARCGLTRRLVPADSELLAHYREGYFEEGAGFSRYFEREAQWRHEAHRRLDWLLRYGRPRQLLEVGSAGGFFLAAAGAAGIEARGIEPSLDACGFARERLGVVVETGLFEEVDVQGSFDVICAFHVLEHVSDPGSFVRRALDLLAPHGFLALEVPNIGSAGAAVEGTRWPNFEPRYHLWHFTPSTLRALLEAAGLEIVALDTIFPRFYARRFRDITSVLMTIRDLRVGRQTGVTDPVRGDFVRVIGRRPV